MPKAVRSILLVLLTAVLLFAVGMATRMPAMRLGVNFGLHAVFAALFYGLIVSVFELKAGHAFPVVAGAVVFGAVLGMMSPVMAVAAWLPALVYLAAFLAMRGAGEAGRMRSAIIGGTLFAAFAYAGTLLGGALFSGYAPSVADLPFLLLSIGLGLLGSVAGTWLAGRLGR